MLLASERVRAEFMTGGVPSSPISALTLPQPKSLLGTPPVAASVRAVFWRSVSAVAGVRAAFCWRRRATAPVTMGEAMLVPWLMRWVLPGRIW